MRTRREAAVGARLLLLALLGAMGVAGCATSRNDALLSASALGAADEDRLIVVTVDNRTTPAPPQPASSRRGYTGGTYSASDAAQRTMQALAREFQLTQVAAWPIAALNVHCAVFRIPAAASRDVLLQQLMRDRRVQLAQQMNGFVSRSATYNDPYVEMQRGFQGIDAESAQQWSRGERVRVAVIDTGLDAKHPDFGGRISVQRNFVDHDALQFERDRHGTAVAGVISASANNRVGIVGVAPAVQIIVLKACWQLAAGGDAARCNSFTLALALAAAIEERVQIVNLSLSGPPDPLLSSLVQAGARRGILYV
ncbi:MAG: S8 family serine peptidase, partial [Steroidobacteraceae bacterium]